MQTRTADRTNKQKNRVAQRKREIVKSQTAFKLGALAWLALLIFNLARATTFAQGTAFTYQGRLNDNGSPANGSYDLAFKLFATNRNGTTLAGPATNSATAISNGMFTVLIDFGPGVFTGSSNWLEIAVRTNATGNFSTLTPRQQITPTPYALSAGTVTGVLPNTGLSGTYGGAVTLNNAANSLAGNGSALTSLSANNLASGTVPTAALGNAWKTTGNVGTSPGANFIGTADNQALDVRVNNSRAIRLQPIANGAPTIVGGSSSNFVDATVKGAVIGGGDYNSIQLLSDYSAISGGSSNSINYASFNSTIGGGLQNSMSPNVQYSVIASGEQNSINNTVFASSIGGGLQNNLQTYVQLSSIAGGYQNQIQQQASYSSISGGQGNIIQTNAAYSMLGGGWNNAIGANYSSIGSGYNNTIATNADYSTVPGGYANQIQPGAQYSSIGGGNYNILSSNTTSSVIGGGNANTIQTSANDAVIGGGLFNQIQANAQWSFIGGGDNNKVGTNATFAVMGGGSNNAIDTNAQYASLLGGQLNEISSSAHFSTIGGGKANTIGVLAQYATIPGGGGNVANGNFSFAAGEYAQALNNQSFVWNDGSAGAFQSTADNQFSVHAAGGVVLNASAGITIAGDVTLSGGADYHNLSLSGGNSLGFLYGAYRPLGDGIHLGYNFYYDASGTQQVPHPGAPTSRISAGYGSVSLATGPNDTPPTDRLYVDINGRVGIGRTPTANLLEVAGNASKTTAGSWLANSDARIKTGIATVTNALETLDRVRLVSFHYTDDYRTTHPGIEDRSYLNVIAQEFARIFPDAVKGSGEKLPDGNEILQVDTYPLTIYSAAAIQELNQKLGETQQAVKAKDSEIQELKDRLTELERILGNK